ncbi:MAG TPA: HAD-IIIA family hydrolase [Candidatus Baltobacteraceae bacterium]|jgi:histidinol-phosphate phosphatase family protein|nr:HAD-IIIA family hydrolase [Candidatus Baltobacteraceae bacterium]
MIRAVLFDRDGTLIADRTNTAARVTPMPHAAAALSRLRTRGIRIGVITNQPVLAHGAMTYGELQAVHREVEKAVGPIDGWFVCPHDVWEGCSCRKPAPGLIHAALQRFAVAAHECVVVGDIGSDIEAGRNAGALSVLVPTPVTLQREISAAPVVREHLDAAVDYVLAWNAQGAA